MLDEINRQPVKQRELGWDGGPGSEIFRRFDQPDPEERLPDSIDGNSGCEGGLAIGEPSG
jgi:hypothetical protein